MVSDQLTAAVIRFVVEAPNGDRKKLFQGVNEQMGPGGSQDGVQATVKDNELPFMPVQGTICPGGSKIIPQIKLTAEDGMDASDCTVNVPIVDSQGNSRYLSAADFGLTDLPAATPANIWIDAGTGYEVANNDAIRLGGGKYFVSFENDA